MSIQRIVELEGFVGREAGLPGRFLAVRAAAF
jgi:hypothetical protein